MTLRATRSGGGTRNVPARRAFVAGLAAVAFGPSLLRAQGRSVPTVGFLRSTPAAPFSSIVDAFRAGLASEGFVEGRNVAIDYRWADHRQDRLREFAADLVRRQVAVIVGNSVAVEAARAATTTIPVVFVTSDDPVERGLVQSLGHPGGNLTGITFHGGGELGAKRLELLRQLVPQAARFAFLVDPEWPSAGSELADVRSAADAMKVVVVPVRAARDGTFDKPFDAIVAAKAGGVVVGGSPYFTSHGAALVRLAARHRLPAIYDQRDLVLAGGLMSYGASFEGAYRQAGAYAGRILKGAKPAELPVLQPRSYDLVINRAAATSLGIAIPESLEVRAEVV